MVSHYRHHYPPLFSSILFPPPFGTFRIARQQMIIAPPTQNQQQIGQATATATIKTESGYQTVPVILQHGGNSNQVGNAIQIQKQIGGIGQQIMQPQTQYMLATNQQGQTYLVAQQQPPPVNQILLTQTSQQQGGAPTKTIIILQQQPQAQRMYILGKENIFVFTVQ